MSSHSMYLIYTFVYIPKGSGGWVQTYAGLGAGRSGRVVVDLLLVELGRRCSNVLVARRTFTSERLSTIDKLCQNYSTGFWSSFHFN